MSIETKSLRATPVGQKAVADVGCGPEEAAARQADLNPHLSVKRVLKESLMTELTNWIDQNQLKPVDAAQILGVTSSRVCDAINKKSAKFTLDALVEMLIRAGKHIKVIVQ